MTYDIAAAFAAHAAQTRYETLPPAALRAAKTFLLDTLGVGLAGSSGANVRAVCDLAPPCAGPDGPITGPFASLPDVVLVLAGRLC